MRRIVYGWDWIWCDVSLRDVRRKSERRKRTKKTIAGRKIRLLNRHRVIDAINIIHGSSKSAACASLGARAGGGAKQEFLLAFTGTRCWPGGAGPLMVTALVLAYSYYVIKCGLTHSTAPVMSYCLITGSACDVYGGPRNNPFPGERT
jgi:hypothetical protein